MYQEDLPVSPAPAEPRTLWLTGLPASGKTTLAYALERELLQRGRACVVLDGDRLRRGLASDLGFSRADRRENLRRAAEVAKLFNEAGLTVIVALIAPHREDRAAARAIVGPMRYVEAYLCTGLAVCEARDPKGHYAKARANLLPEFTGVSAPYEAPAQADVVIDTGRLAVADCVEQLLRSLDRPPGLIEPTAPSP